VGYPLRNIIFEDTRRGVLYQDGNRVDDFDLGDPKQLVDLLNTFLTHAEPDIEGFEKAVGEFKERVPELAGGLIEKIEEAHRDNKKFQEAFSGFFNLCKTSLNPNIAEAAIDQMLVQHLLTVRLFRTIFDNADFTRRNVIAAEIEKVIDALTSQAFSRQEFLKSLDRFYVAIEEAAKGLQEFSEKQHFLNTVYEQFFQGYSVKVADTHGIVYTPQEIVDFMCASVEEVLKTEFGLSLGSEEVNILDPCTGTGNFIVNLLRRIPKRDLPRMYGKQLFGNEVMLLPYYIAALNIEHAYYELTGQYEPFEGLCFVDTLDLGKSIDVGGGADQDLIYWVTEENTKRVERQKEAAITVIIGNPRYNMGQINENDNNKNRKYEEVDRKIRQTYVTDSRATLHTKLYDAYVRFFRWATDRLGNRAGIVCLVTNNGFVDGVAFGGFRKHLLLDFNRVYHFDFKGNARTSGERWRREGGNIFSDQIRVGVGITVLVKRERLRDRNILYHSVNDYWRADHKKRHLSSFGTLSDVPWNQLTPDNQQNWFSATHADDYETFVPLGSKATKAQSVDRKDAVFGVFSPGVNTARDSAVYGFDLAPLQLSASQFCEDYNSEVDRYKRKMPASGVDEFVDYSKVKWSSTLKAHLKRLTYAEYGEEKIRLALYRPFNKRFLFYDNILLDRPALFRQFFPREESGNENEMICTPGIGNKRPPFCVIADSIADFHFTGDTTQCFPFYVYDEDGGNRRENITDWALEQFRSAYGDESISKWDIFYYVYGLLHHPGYREKYADCLKRELPRIPLAGQSLPHGRGSEQTQAIGGRSPFGAFSNAGKELAELHLNYEEIEPYELDWIETPDVPLSYRVQKMRLSKDKSSLVVNETLTLGGIPPEVFDYRLGNRSALDWVIDQYRVKTDKRSGITSDPNRKDDPEYIVRLAGQVVQVSLDTVRVVKGLPEEFGG